MDNPRTINEELRLFWIGCGTKDSLYQGNVDLLAKLDVSNVQHITHIDDGIHGWVVWRFYLNDFLPLLFK